MKIIRKIKSEILNSIIETKLHFFFKKVNAKIFQKKHLYTRIACLGQEILSRNSDFDGYQILNIQKVRLDGFFEMFNGINSFEPNAVIKNLARKDISPLIRQQVNFPWKICKISNPIIVMDSFSELTDQKFTNQKNNAYFFSHYSDLIHSQIFQKEYISEGLLPEDQFFDAYDNFFKWCREYYGNPTIYFIHFPTKLDSRTIFSKRAECIHTTLEKMAEKYSFVHNISIPQNNVHPALEDSFPYHYGEETYQSFVKEMKIKMIGNNK